MPHQVPKGSQSALQIQIQSGVEPIQHVLGYRIMLPPADFIQVSNLRILYGWCSRLTLTTALQGVSQGLSGSTCAALAKFVKGYAGAEGQSGGMSYFAHLTASAYLHTCVPK